MVVACLDPHNDDHQEVCGDIICDDQSCSDPTDCHGIYEFVSLSFLSYSFLFQYTLSIVPLLLWVQIYPMRFNNFLSSLKIILPVRRSPLVPPL